MTQVKTQVKPSTVIDARGPRFGAVITTAVLATALATSNLWVIVAQAIVFALGAFRAEAWKQALSYGVKVTGCTVHWVDQGVDTGPILAQQAVPVLEGDTVSSLHQRIQEAERTLYPETLARLAQGPWTTKVRPTSNA